MNRSLQFNLLAAVCVVAFVVLALAGKPAELVMAPLALAGTIAGRGK